MSAVFPENMQAEKPSETAPVAKTFVRAVCASGQVAKTFVRAVCFGRSNTIFVHRDTAQVEVLASTAGRDTARTKVLASDSRE